MTPAEREIVDAARALAWFTHVNLSSTVIYRARQEAFERLRFALRVSWRPRAFELAAVVSCARVLAACSDSNRQGVAYYERKAAFAQLRGALAVYDETEKNGLIPTRT